MEDKHCLERLRDIFPFKNIQLLKETIELVDQQGGTADEKIQNAVEILINNQDDDEEADGAFGYQNAFHKNTCCNFLEFYDKLQELFPDCCPDYLMEICKECDEDYGISDCIEQLSTEDYPKRDPLDLFEHFKDLLPNADPSYLEQQARILISKSVNHVKDFVENAIEKADYPTLEDYRVRLRQKQQVSKYTDKFSIEQFVELIPDPFDYFSSGLSPLSTQNEGKGDDEETLTFDREYALIFLSNHYRFHRIKHIKKIFESYDYDLIQTTNRLDVLPKAFLRPRAVNLKVVETMNVPLLQEIAFLTHKTKIKAYLKYKDENYRRMKEEAEKYGLLQTCSCCYDNELIPEECYFCKKDCVFCKDCVRKGVEVAIGEGKLVFPCLADCGSEFGLPTLQMVLDSVVFSRLIQRMQMEEIRQANIEGVESCPFCDYSYIPAPEDKIFKCLNYHCKKETCRKCKHVSHIPTPCEEIEYDEDVKMRTYIENKMTLALLRKCWKCSKYFIKETGCNMMTCSCSAKMCYCCGKAIDSYNHFNETGCPVHTQNLNKYHYEEVMKGAIRAKQELGVNNDPTKLKFDPTRDIDQHFK